VGLSEINGEKHEIQKYVELQFDIPDGEIFNPKEAARCRMIGLGYNPDDITQIIIETPKG
jgi:hypothetical protein